MSKTKITPICSILYSFIKENNKDKSQNELDNLIEIAIENNDYSFSTGLLGAGWLVAYLHQQEILTDDINELLYDFDDNFYKLAIKVIVEPDPNLTDLIEISTYYQQRLQNKSTSYNFYRRFIVFEVMKLLTEQLVKKVNSEHLTKSELVLLILKLSYLSKTYINEKEIEDIYYSKTEELISYYQQLSIFTAEDTDNIKLLQLASIQFGNPYWIKEIDKILLNDNLTESSPLGFITTSMNSFLRNEKEADFNLSNLNFIDKEDMLYLIISNVKNLKCN